MAIGHGVQTVAKVDWGDGDSVLAVVDASAVGKDVDVCTLGAELAVTLYGENRASLV